MGWGFWRSVSFVPSQCTIGRRNQGKQEARLVCNESYHKAMNRLAVSLVSFLVLTGCASVDPTLNDPTGTEVATISGSSANGPTGVDISISAIDDEPRAVGAKPSWTRKVSPGQHRVTVYVLRLLQSGLTEFPFVALPRHRYEVRSRDGGGFYLIDFTDVTDPLAPQIILSGKFGASGSVLVSSPFIPLSPDRK